MTVRLPRLPKGEFEPKLQWYWQRLCEGIEAEFGAIEAATAAQAAAVAAQTAADAAQTTAIAAQTTADTAQSTADAVEATVAALVIPPTGSRTVSVDSTSSASDATLLVDATAGIVEITLHPAALAIGNLIVQKIDASANAVNVVPGGGDNLNGGPGAETLTTQYEQRTFTNDGLSEWFA